MPNFKVIFGQKTELQVSRINTFSSLKEKGVTDRNKDKNENVANRKLSKMVFFLTGTLL